MAASARLDGNTIYVNELPILSIRAGSLKSRSAAAIGAVQRHDGKPTAKAVKISKSRAAVILGSTRLITVEKADALSANTESFALAQQWAKNLNRALSMPPLKLGAESIRIGNGGAIKVGLVGSAAAKATVESSDETIAKFKRIPGSLMIQGLSAGKAEIVVSAGQQILTLSVKVIPSAAVFPQTAIATVTGMPCNSTTARIAVETAINSQLKTQPGADLRFTVGDVNPVPFGEARTVPVRVRVVAPDAVPTEGVVNVLLRNTPISIDPEDELWYCNYPENLTKHGQIFGARLKAGKPARMLYHHINEMGKGLLFHAQVVNDSTSTARVLLIPGDSPIDKNPVYAGIVAADRFMRNWIQSSGEVLTIPPRSSVPLSFRRLGPKDTVSGLVYLNLIDGPDQVTVRADVKPTFQAEGRWASALASNYPWRELGPQPARQVDLEEVILSEHIYPQPFRNVDVNYEVGGRHGFVRIGQQPIARQDGKSNLSGNFGVIYTIRARLENQTSLATDVEVVFESSAGYSGALFVVNGQVVRTPLMQPKDELRILRLRLESGESRQFTMQTIPLSGSSYPATLAIRPTNVALAGNGKRK
jgi:hypothetical protein